VVAPLCGDKLILFRGLGVFPLLETFLPPFFQQLTIFIYEVYSVPPELPQENVFSSTHFFQTMGSGLFFPPGMYVGFSFCLSFGGE